MDRHRLYRFAGVPPAYFQQTIDEYPALTPHTKAQRNLLLHYRDTLGVGGIPEEFTLTVEPRWLEWAAAWCTKAQVDGIRVAGIVGMASLEEWTTWFVKDQSVFRTCQLFHKLAIGFGMEYSQQIHTHVLKYLIETRSDPKRFHTIFFTTKTKGEVGKTYGDQVRVDLEQRGKWL